MVAGGGPQINWDNMTEDALVTTEADAARDSAVPFEVRTPRFEVEPWRVEVTDPAKTEPEDRAITFMYRYPVGEEFPDDGRVIVRMQATQIDNGHLRKMFEERSWTGQYDTVTISGEPALLIHSDKVGRVMMVRDGVQIDITGSAASPESVQRLAAQI